ncbi:MULTISPECIES: stress-induced protein YchH [Xenorhabdus]|uniref:Stress-induced protein YchH n=5 Tax=Xenorhabdus TaxID=626 RepID=A0A0B6X5Y8_XENBV|nr:MULTISPECIES: stress-induced protein YchH [Xenorhabdus]MCG3463781.1 stress-induced protein YchH [Xenorhabdus bovienii]MCG3471199.1 stress-induced protein YchH [Xenorhabdus bovienii]MDC9622346.1 stress-induced protein YchH [Xenorhabdus aichiensis]MDE1473919.1 stress-induced protein YchH [Xenorhabdus bovienii]MDE1478015.1 stress-induced protein YchH [Xenorhabdus bovienii]
MKRKNAFILGNIFMGLGMAAMLISLSYVLLSHVFSLDQSGLATGISLMGLFVGALVWLAGASIGGREQVTDKYWWLKNYDERYRRKKHRTS